MADPAVSIPAGAGPAWTYDGGYYNSAKSKFEGNFEIRTHPIKGKGLYALRSYKVGDVLLSETALGCAQDISASSIPVCSNCLVSLETPCDIFERVVGSSDKFKEAADVHMWPVGPRKIVNCDQPCGERYCSEECKAIAAADHHRAICRNSMDEHQRSTCKDFMAHPWHQGGVDYTDTHALALRLVAKALTAHRFGGMTIEDAYAPMEQLIKAPLNAFRFSFLIRTETASDKRLDEKVRQRKYWQQARDTRKPLQDDTVKDDEGVSNREMIALGLKMLYAIFKMTDSEISYINAGRWSRLLGAVLLNGQERSPHSPYVQFKNALKTQGEDTPLRLLHQALKAEGKTLTDMKSSTKGQAIYNVGCLFNHSCHPNLEMQYDSEKNDETLVALCLRPIQAGDEICISYIDEDMSFFERQEQLAEHYLFDCGCQKCEKEAEVLGLKKAACTLPEDKIDEVEIIVE